MHIPLLELTLHIYKGFLGEVSHVLWSGYGGHSLSNHWCDVYFFSADELLYRALMAAAGLWQGGCLELSPTKQSN